MYRSQSDNDGTEESIMMEWPAVEVEYVPDVSPPSVYISWGNMLVVNGMVYDKDGNIYRKTGERLEDLFRTEEDIIVYSILQYKNFLITIERVWQEFIVYNIDSGEASTYPCYDVYSNWYVYDGQIFYHQHGENNYIYCIDMRTSEQKEIYKCKDYIYKLLMRNDGIMIAETAAPGSGDLSKEYWLIYPDGNGIYTGEKIWEQSKYIFTTLFGFTEYGLFINGEYYGSEGHAADLLCLKVSGETEVIDFRFEGTLIAENGYYRWDSLMASEETKDRLLNSWSNDAEKYAIVDSVTYYDFQGNKIQTYRLIEDEWLDAGYKLEVFLYNAGQITAFYACEDREELYISRMQVE